MSVAGASRLFSIFALAVPGMALAQVPTRDQVEPPVPAKPADRGKIEIDSRAALERAPCPLETSTVMATITRVEFTSSRGGALAPEIAALLQSIGGVGANQPIRVVCDIRDRANEALRQAKYVATVQVPAQRIEDGTLRLEVVTARIVEMRVRGDPGPYERVIQENIDALKRLDPLNEAEAERLLLLVGDTPGLDVLLSLRPAGTTPGDVIGEMTVDYKRLSVIANAQNYNSRQLGRETGYVRAEYRGITGAADSAFLGLSSTFQFDEQKIVQVGYQIGINGAGTTIGTRLTYAISRPDLDQLRLQTKSVIATFELSHPLVRSVNANFGITSGIEYSQQRTVVQSNTGNTPLNLDRVTTLFLRAAGDWRALTPTGEDKVRVGGFFELRQGIAAFGATKTGVVTPDGFTPSRFEGSATPTIVRGAIDTKFGLGPIFDLAGSVRGQWSNRALLNFDEFAVGNLTIGRGYDPGSNSGDRAIGASIELRAKVLRSPKLRVELFGFYDAARIWNIDSNSTENNRVLRSYGGGFRLTLPGSALLEVTYARPQDKALSFDKAPPSDRVLVSLTMQLVPFGGAR